MFQNARGFHYGTYHHREQHGGSVSIIGQPRPEYHNFPPNFTTRRTSSCVSGIYNQHIDFEGFGAAPQHTLQVQDPGHFAQEMNGKANFTLPLENNDMGDMMRAFMACQFCKEICTKPKQLKCSHTICQQCAGMVKTRNGDTGEWMIRCKACSLVTTWFGKSLDGLKDNTTMQKLVARSGSTKTKKGRNGKITMYGEQDMTINIVSYTKEKGEIEKSLQSAEKKIENCHQQTRYVKEYEKKINREKARIKREIDRAVESYIEAIRGRRDKLVDELDHLFEKDYQPAKEARHTIKVQMQSLKLVTQCCCVGSRILEKGGAPLDLENFKQMVRKTMKTTKAGKLPTAIYKPYKTAVKFQANDKDYSTLSKHIGSLVDRSRRAKVIPKQEEPSKEESEDEPIYDLPPDVELKFKEVEEECLYDEIPFFADNDQLSGEHTNTSEDNEQSSPPKSEVDEQYPELPPLPPPPPPFMLLNPQDEDLTQKTAEIFARRRAINGYDSAGSEDTDDSFSSDSFSDDEVSPEEQTRPQSPAKSTRSTRSKSYGGNSDDKFRIPTNESSNLKRSSMGNVLGHTRNNSLSVKSNKSKLLYCIGRAKKAGCDNDKLQPFSVSPEIAVSSDDTVWLTDNQNHRVQAHEGATGQLTGIVKITSAHNVALKPKSLTALCGGKQIAVSSGKCVTLWTSGGEWVRQIGPSPDFGKVGGLACDSCDNIVLADIENGALVVNEKRNRCIPDVVVAGKSQWLGRIAVNSMDQIIVPDYSQHEVKVYESDGTLNFKFGSFGVGTDQFRYPSAVALDDQNRIYVADECNNRITLFSAEGEFISHVLTKENGLTFPHAIAVFSNGCIAVSDDSKLVKVYSTE